MALVGLALRCFCFEAMALEVHLRYHAMPLLRNSGILLVILVLL